TESQPRAAILYECLSDDHLLVALRASLERQTDPRITFSLVQSIANCLLRESVATEATKQERIRLLRRVLEGEVARRIVGLAAKTTLQPVMWFLKMMRKSPEQFDQIGVEFLEQYPRAELLAQFEAAPRNTQIQFLRVVRQWHPTLSPDLLGQITLKPVL